MYTETLSTALAHHQRGELEQAERLYRQILAAQPDHADALHLLGVMAVQAGQPRQGVELIERAIALLPGQAVFYGNLSEAYRACGDLDRAAACSQVAVRLQPDSAERLNSAGATLLQQGRVAEAADCFRQAIQKQPDFSLAHTNLGNTCRIQGDYDGAVAHFRRAVELSPELGYMHGNLGQMLLETHQPREALHHCREALRLQPDSVPSLNNLGNVLRKLGQRDEAAACYSRALKLAPNMAMVSGNIGQLLQEEGKFEDAVRWYDQALRLEPTAPRFHVHLAGALIEKKDFEAAETHLQTALRLDPRYGEAHLGLGQLRYEQDRLDEAIEAYRASIRMQPNNPIAHSHLGEVLLELNQQDEAVASFRTALSYDPRNAPSLGQLAVVLRDKMSDEDRATLRQVLDDPLVTERDRTTLRFGLAQVCDARGEYDEAAAHLAQANAQEHAVRRQRGESYRAEVHVQFVNRLLEVFTPEFFERVGGFGLDSERPVFIFGLPRSGTTLLEQVLASHSKVYGSGELLLARQDFETLGQGGDGMSEARAFDALTAIDADGVRRLAGAHLDRLQALNADAERVTDKMPDNYLYVGFLSMLFPRATFIHCRRDPRDVAVSCWMTQFRQIPWANDLNEMASRFAQYQRVMEHWRNVLPQPMLEVDYEELVRDLEGVSRHVLAVCGLEWEPACLEFHRTERPIRTASLTQVRQPLYRRSLQRWRHYETALQPLFARLVGPSGHVPPSNQVEEMPAEMALQV